MNAGDIALFIEEVVNHDKDYASTDTDLSRTGWLRWGWEIEGWDTGELTITVRTLGSERQVFRAMFIEVEDDQ